VRERRGRRRVGDVVGRHVNRLTEVIEPFFVDVSAPEARPSGAERRLVTDRHGMRPREAENLGAGLREPEDVVDERSTSCPLRPGNTRPRSAGQATRSRDPGAPSSGPKMSARFSMTPDSFISWYRSFLARPLAHAGE